MLKPLYLASQSPRRLELLRQIGLAPALLYLRNGAGRLDVDETPLPEEQAVDYVSRLARLKAEAGELARHQRSLADWPIVAADTTVTLGGEIIGKPADAAEAAAVLRRYSGRSHSVLTGVAVVFRGRLEVALSESTVAFRALSEEEIAAYIAYREPFDKAGGYGIQGRAAMFVERIEGSYSGVMGLPLFETAYLLRKVGFPVL
jgi:septum formation protein